MIETARKVIGTLGFSEPMTVRPKFHANDKTRDVLNVIPRPVPIEDVRHRATAPSLDGEGFRLYPHRSQLRDIRLSGFICRRSASCCVRFQVPIR
jgi:hypothetical protein